MAGAEIEACAVAEAEAKSVVTAIAAVKLVRGLAKATGTTELAEGPEPISTAVVVVVAEATGAVAAITTEAVRPTTESVAAATTATPSEAEEQVT